MVSISEDALSALDQMVLGQSDRVVRLSASQVCDCGKIGFVMDWDTGERAGDLSQRYGSLTVVYDEKSRPYLDGLEIGYRSELMGKNFTFYNPRLKNGGGCGGGRA